MLLPEAEVSSVCVTALLVVNRTRWKNVVATLERKRKVSFCPRTEVEWERSDYQASPGISPTKPRQQSPKGPQVCTGTTPQGLSLWALSPHSAGSIFMSPREASHCQRLYSTNCGPSLLAAFRSSVIKHTQRNRSVILLQVFSWYDFS